MTDVEGVLENRKLLKSLSIQQAQEKIKNIIITDGMIPKLESAVETIESGVGRVLISNNLINGTVIKGGQKWVYFFKIISEFIKVENIELIDQKGRYYIDFSSGIGVTNLGFHSSVREAVSQQLEHIWHSPNIYNSIQQEQVAEKLIHNKAFRSFFCNSGTEANEAAIKLARKATKKY